MEKENCQLIATTTTAAVKKCTGIVKNAIALVQSGNLTEASIQLGSLKEEGKKIIKILESIIQKQTEEEANLIEKVENIQRQIAEVALREDKLKEEQRFCQHELQNKNRQLEDANSDLSRAESERDEARQNVDKVKDENKSRIIATSIIGGVAALFTGPVGIMVASGIIARTLADAEGRLSRAKSGVERRYSDVKTAKQRVRDLESKVQAVKVELKSCENIIAELERKRRECHDQVGQIKEKIIFFKQGMEFWSLLLNLSEENIDRSDLLIRILEKSSEKPKALLSSGSELLANTFLEAWEEFITKSETGLSNYYLPAIEEY